jgi:hypothetical protein
MWIADVEPGSVHDLTVAREHVLGALYWAASQLELPTLPDGGNPSGELGHTSLAGRTADTMARCRNRS